jgi:Domain of unknown function (DUF4333)
LTVPVRPIAAVALLGLLLLAVSGCGGTVIDNVKAEETLQASLEKSLHEKIKQVDCPANVNVEPGNTFSCVVDFSKGKEATAILKIRDSDANVTTVGLKPKANAGTANE